MVKLQIIGGGKMGEAILVGLLAGSGGAVDGPADVHVVEKVAARRDELLGQFPGLSVNDELVAAAGTVIAVKPVDVPAAAKAAVAADGGCILSIAAGVSLRALEAACGEGVPVVRSMPNTPSLVGKGAAVIAGGAAATEADLAWAESILGAVGIVERVDESLLDAVTGLSGSGPAYVFLVAESMIEAGVLAGIPRDIAERLTAQTLLGSATLLAESGQPAAVLRANVTSPGGTTAAGLQALEDGGVRASFLRAVQAATQRSRQLDA